MSTASRRGLTRSFFALAAAAAVHLGILSLMALSFPDQKEPPSEWTVEMQAVGVYLSPAEKSHGTSPAIRRHEMTPQPARARSTNSPNVRIAPPAMAVAPPVSASSGSASKQAVNNGVQGAASGGDGRAQSALRSLTGCNYSDLTRLTEAEREHCEQRLRRAAEGAPVLPIGPSDPQKRAILEHEMRVDDAFRSYRASSRMDDYPGLRTFVPMPRALKELLDHGEPRQLSDDAPPPQ